MEDNNVPLPMEISRQIDAICNRFEDAWLGNRTPRIEDCLTEVDETHRSKLLHELLLVELECRIRCGDEPSVDDYCRRFTLDEERVELLLRQVRSTAESLPGTHGRGQYLDSLACTETAVQSLSSPLSRALPHRLGNYELLEEIGRGGMGRVYRARHLHLESLVAIKILGPNASNSPEAVARFRHEARAVARLKHPNIVIAHDADQEHGTPFLVLEYIEGVDLASLVKREGPRPVKEALEFVIQAAEGFEYAHSQGMIHRDIKPSNLLVDSARRIKILDLNWPPSTARSLTSRRIGRT